MHKQFLYFFILSFFFKIGFSQLNTTIPSKTIGTQTWSTSNLNVSQFRNGEDIPEAKTEAEWISAGNNHQPAWCYYDNDPANGTKYGKLYNWYAVNDPRGLAPRGWHVPSIDEWYTLTEYLGGDKVAGEKMKSPNGWIIWVGGKGVDVKSSGLIDEKNIGSNSSEFNGLGGGNCYLGKFRNLNEYGIWWSSSEYKIYDNNSSLDCSVFGLRAEIGRSTTNKATGNSVRLVKDNFTGEYKEYYSNGNLKSISHYKDGNQEGECKMYFENGQLSNDYNLKENNLDGEYKAYYENGQLWIKKYYKNGIGDGDNKEYYSNGNLKSISHYKNGNLEGEWKQYFKNGQISHDYNLKNNKLDGECKAYYENGQLWSKLYYKNDVIIDKGQAVSENNEHLNNYFTESDCNILVGNISKKTNQNPSYKNEQWIKNILMPCMADAIIPVMKRNGISSTDDNRYQIIYNQIDNCVTNWVSIKNETSQKNLVAESLLRAIFSTIGDAAKNPSSNSSKPQNNNSKNKSSSNINTGKNDKHSYNVLITWNNPNCGNCPYPKPSAQNGIVDYFYERAGSYRVIPVCPICGKKQYNTISGFTSNIGTSAQGSSEKVINCN